MMPLSFKFRSQSSSHRLRVLWNPNPVRRFFPDLVGGMSSSGIVEVEVQGDRRQSLVAVDRIRSPRLLIPANT